VKTISHPNNYKRVVEWAGQKFTLMLLPMFSLSKPDATGMQRLVFDWGKSLPHPNARIAIAILSSNEGQYIRTLVIDDISYQISGIKKCRSGRCAAQVMSTGPVYPFDQNLIKKLVEQEFSKNTE
jgi:hypothetical protein